MQSTCWQEAKAGPLRGNKFPVAIAHFYSFSLHPWFIAFARLQHDKSFSFQHKMIFQTPLNIFVRQGQPTKLNCLHKDWLLFKAGERLQGIITLSKIFQLQNQCLFLQYFWLCANLFPTFHGFSPLLPIYWKVWQMSVVYVTGHPGLLSYCYQQREIRTPTGAVRVRFLWFVSCLHFNELLSTSPLISLVWN